MSITTPAYLQKLGTDLCTGFTTGFTLGINPFASAVYLPVQSVISQLIEPGVKKHLEETESKETVSKVYAFVTFLLSVLISTTMTAGFGLPIQFGAALWLHVFIIPMSHIIGWIWEYAAAHYKTRP